MIDFHEILYGLTQVIRRPNFTDVEFIAAVLDLDTSESPITKTDKSLLINRARLNPSGIEVGIAGALFPWREIWVMFVNPSIPYHDVKDEVFGVNQHIVPSKLSAGFGLLFDIHGLTCGLTASSPDGNLECLSGEERGSSTGTAPRIREQA